MSERSEYNPGEFCWVELVVPDPDAAASFYGELIGWERERYEPDPEAYWYFRYQMAIGDVMPMEVPPHWQVYLCIANVDEAVDQVKTGGGSLLFGPQPIPVGKFAVCSDPQGADVALLEPDFPEAR